MLNKNEKLRNCIWFYLLTKHLEPRHPFYDSIYLVTSEEFIRSSYHSQTSLLLPTKLWNWEDQTGLPPQSNDINSLSLSVCLYWPEKFCVQGLALSVRMYVMVFQDQHTLTKWNILSNCLLIHSRERIFHFGRVCWSWKTITYIRNRESKALDTNFSGQYIQASKPLYIYQCPRSLLTSCPIYSSWNSLWYYIGLPATCSRIFQ